MTHFLDEALHGKARGHVCATAMLSAANTLQNLLTNRTASLDRGLSRTRGRPAPLKLHSCGMAPLPGKYRTCFDGTTHWSGAPC